MEKHDCNEVVFNTYLRLMNNQEVLLLGYKSILEYCKSQKPNGQLIKIASIIEFALNKMEKAPDEVSDV